MVRMGNRSTKSGLRNAIVFLNISADPIATSDDKFWGQIFGEEAALAEEVIKSITVQEIRILRDGSPKNFAALAYKMVERLCLATGTLCNTNSQQTAVLNAIRILIRMLPCCFEDRAWRNFFEDNHIELAQNLRAEPRLVYPEKGVHERDYLAYLPHRPGSRCATPGESVIRASGQDSCRAPIDDNSLMMDDVDLLMSDQQPPPPQVGVDRESSRLASEEARRGQASAPGRSLMKALVLSICDLLFCPEFTVLPHGVGYLSNAVDTPPEDLKSLSTYDYVWEPGVGFESSINSTTNYDKNRYELLRALLVCLSVTLYETPESSIKQRNGWLETLVSPENRHALPLFTSLLNVLFGYRPPGALLRINQHFLAERGRERLVGGAAELLSAVLDYNQHDQTEPEQGDSSSNSSSNSSSYSATATESHKNLFNDYMSRIHRAEDFVFIMRGFARLMNAGLAGPGYIWASSRSCLELEQELQLLLWRVCNLNRRFMQFLLISNECQELVVAILHHLNENFREPSKSALVHIGVFNLLILSSERNFGVRLNKAYTAGTLTNLPDFSGTHADLMIIVFHKLIMYGYKISQLYDYLLTILVNVSPYLKGTTILASKCLIQLFETFSSPLVVFTEPAYHQLVVFLLEFFNNIVQYQFDGNSNLIYVIMSKKELFTSLASLATSQAAIDKVLRRLIKQRQRAQQAASAGTGTGTGTGTNEYFSNSVRARDVQLDCRSRRSPPATGPVGGCASSNPTARRSDESQAAAAPPFEDSEEADQRRVATVSCRSNNPTASDHLESGARKQEVSLVATPDLYHITLPIFPFVSDGAQPAARLERASDGVRANGTATCERQIIFNFDDIVTTSEPSSGAQAATTKVAAAEEQQQQQQQQRPEMRQLPVVRQEHALDAAESNQHNSAPCKPTVGCETGGEPAPRRCDRWRRPTSELLRQWKQGLPIQTVVRMIAALEPQLEQVARQQREGASGRALVGCDESETIKFLQNCTLVGLLPVPHPIQIRKYRTNRSSTLWFRACSWGLIYVRSSIWTGTDVKLIKMMK